MIRIHQTRKHSLLMLSLLTSLLLTTHSIAASIDASVNPVSVAPSTTGSTTISWHSALAGVHQVWVSVDGNTSSLMSCGGPTGSNTVSWIQANKQYTFTLHAASGCSPGDKGTELASVVVDAYDDRLVKNGTGLFLAGEPYQAMGMNKFDLFHQFLGVAHGNHFNAGSTGRTITKPLALDHLDDAEDEGIRYFRIAGVGFYPAHMNLWLNTGTRNTYWSYFDEMVDECADRGIKLVPVIWWNKWLFPDMAAESFDQLFVSGSDARDYLFEYAEELVDRYKDDDTILFWELTNEINLGADLDYGSRTSTGIAPSLGTPTQRDASDNYSTAEMADLMEDLADLIKGLDPTRLISAGYSRPRPNAYHLAASPEWSGPDWTTDSISEMTSYMSSVNPDPIEIVSIHLYNNGDHEQLGNDGKYNPDILADYKTAIDSLGKVTYLGEYGDYDPFVVDDRSANFTRRITLELLDLRIPISSLWVWQFFQGSTTTEQDLSITPTNDAALIEWYSNVDDLLVAASTSPSVALSVPNPSLENDTDNDGKPDGWETIWRNGTSTDWSATMTTADPFLGSTSLELFSGTNADSHLYVLSDPISVTAGSRLVLSAAMKHDEAVGRAKMLLIEYNGSGTPLMNHTYTNATAGDGDYEVQKVVADLSGQAATVRIRFSVGGLASGGTLTIDDIRLSQID